MESDPRRKRDDDFFDSGNQSQCALAVAANRVIGVFRTKPVEQSGGTEWTERLLSKTQDGIAGSLVVRLENRNGDDWSTAAEQTSGEALTSASWSEPLAFSIVTIDEWLASHRVASRASHSATTGLNTSSGAKSSAFASRSSWSAVGAQRPFSRRQM
jgi:hypothetical protein